jgi:hypothetical protein
MICEDYKLGVICGWLNWIKKNIRGRSNIVRRWRHAAVVIVCAEMTYGRPAVHASAFGLDGYAAPATHDRANNEQARVIKWTARMYAAAGGRSVHRVSRFRALPIATAAKKPSRPNALGPKISTILNKSYGPKDGHPCTTHGISQGMMEALIPTAVYLELRSRRRCRRRRRGHHG